MSGVTYWLGWLLLVVGGVLIALGIAAWPPGGLMFALPYVFFLSGAPLVVAGGLMVLLNRSS